MAFKWLGKSEDGNTVTLRKLSSISEVFSPPQYVNPEWRVTQSDLIRVGLVVDVETTGLDRGEDKVIEIGVQRFEFNRTTGEILSLNESYTGLQDPGEPLDPGLTLLTGLTDEILRGQSIDWPQVETLFSGANVVIAHNAGFDRPFVERHVPSSASKIWACTHKQIDWWAKGFSIQKLEMLCIFHGFFIDAHRALNDVHALTHLLSFRDHQTQTPYLQELLTNARRSFVKVVAANSPFETKDLLKGRGYAWDTAIRSWRKQVYKEELEQEIAWLESAVYGGRFGGTTHEIPITDNFKDRN